MCCQHVPSRESGKRAAQKRSSPSCSYSSHPSQHAPHCLEPHLDAMRLGMFGNRAIGRKQGKLPVAAGPFIKGFDLTTPSLMLAVVDLAQVQHLPLYHLAASAALALDNIPIAMFFAVFEASVESQKHDANQLTPNQTDEKILGLHYRRFESGSL